MPMNWSVDRLGPALGARVVGPDLSGALSVEEQTALQALLLEHLVLAFPGQDLEPADHVAFGRNFGDPLVHPYLEPIEGHPEILRVVKEPDDDLTFGGEFWHADITFMNPPSSVSLLQALELPSIGGDTLFANQYLALETLSPAMQEMLSGLDAVHLYPGKSENEPGAHAVHPVVRRHQQSGRHALFVNAAFTTRFVGMTERESRGLLDFLFAHSTQNEFVTRLGWEPGQLTIWDNRAVLHYAMNDYRGQRRALQRVATMEVDQIV